MKHFILPALILLTSSTALAAPKTKYVGKSNVEWQRFSKGYPLNAVKLGKLSSGTPQFVCRVNYKGAWHPGRSWNNTCYFGYGGREVVTKNFQVMNRVRPLTIRRTITKNSVVAGIENGQKRIVCTAKYKGETHIGKTVSGKCFIGLYGKELTLPISAVLTHVPTKSKVVRVPANKQEWLRFSKGYPTNAIPGGRLKLNGGTPQFVCRVNYKGAWHPGRSWNNTCYFGYGGREVVTKNFQVMNRVRPLTWKRTITKNSVVAGIENGQKRIVCTAKYKGETHIGKTVGGKCYIGLYGKELMLPIAAVLTYVPAASVAATRPKWISFKGTFPSNAVVASKLSGKPSQVCRVWHKGAFHPGKIWVGKCHYGYGGKEIYTTKFQLLIKSSNMKVTWSKKITPKTILGGVEGGQKRYVCIANHKNGAHTGKTVNGKCYIGWGGKEVIKPSFYYLNVR